MMEQSLLGKIIRRILGYETIKNELQNMLKGNLLSVEITKNKDSIANKDSSNYFYNIEIGFGAIADDIFSSTIGVLDDFTGVHYREWFKKPQKEEFLYISPSDWEQSGVEPFLNENDVFTSDPSNGAMRPIDILRVNALFFIISHEVGHILYDNK